MGRPKGGKNAMRTPEEKEAIVLEYLNGQSRSIRKTAEKYGITDELLRGWMARYRESGVDGLRSQTGRHGVKHGNGLKGLNLKKDKTREEELELENLRLKIEVARLKKGYRVKGVVEKRNTLLPKARIRGPRGAVRGIPRLPALPRDVRQPERVLQMEAA